MIKSVYHEKFKRWLDWTHPPCKVIISARFLVWFGRPASLYGRFDSLHVVELPPSHIFGVISCLVFLVCFLLQCTFYSRVLRRRESPTRINCQPRFTQRCKLNVRFSLHKSETTTSHYSHFWGCAISKLLRGSKQANLCRWSQLVAVQLEICSVRAEFRINNVKALSWGTLQKCNFAGFLQVKTWILAGYQEELLGWEMDCACYRVNSIRVIQFSKKNLHCVVSEQNSNMEDDETWQEAETFESGAKWDIDSYLQQISKCDCPFNFTVVIETDQEDHWQLEIYPKESNEASPHSGIEPQGQISKENRCTIISVLLGTSSFSILKQKEKAALSTVANDSHVQRVCRCSIANFETSSRLQIT